ncbi:MAG TPA: dTDP-4-dehydrorhamnose 3,5-epimerase [Gammaproteobacteria bacterium]|nr:dTDP-4-dehydrorhamnose 3,5-epimerase [Gammaproteobacteria bacterium]
MEVTETAIPDVKVLRPRVFGDDRGFFSETYNRRALAERGVELEFVQDNHSRSAEEGTVRGLHFQVPPHAQDKLVRVVRGAILDVAVDLRRGSPTCGRHVTTTISAEAWNQVLIPVGFAHGFCTLQAGTEVIYKVTDFYAPDHDRGLRWNDPQLGIDWPVSEDRAVLSEKDRDQPLWTEIETPF